MKLITISALVALLPLAISRGAETSTEASAHTLAEWKLGAHVAGPQVTLEEAKGKAVLLDYWGVNCGPCLASLPDIEKIARRHKDKMIVIGAHSQAATDEEIQAVVKKNRLSFTITKGAPGPVKVSGIPRVIVFDTAGKMIFEGHPSNKDFERAVRKSVQGASSTASGSATKPSGLDSLKRPGT